MEVLRRCTTTDEGVRGGQVSQRWKEEEEEEEERWTELLNRQI